jgi:hypothetical protein
VRHARGDRAPRLSFGHGALVGGCYVGKGLLRGEGAASDELLLVCVGEEG